MEHKYLHQRLNPAFYPHRYQRGTSQLGPDQLLYIKIIVDTKLLPLRKHHIYIYVENFIFSQSTKL